MGTRRRAATARQRATRQAFLRGQRAVIDRANRRTGGFRFLEKKFYDTSIVNTATSTTWAAVEDATADTISAVAQGDGESDRDGRVYEIHSLHIRGIISSDLSEGAASPINDSFVRIAVVLDTQTNGAQLTATAVHETGGTPDYLSFRNLQNTGRFKILYDKSFVIKPQSMNEGAVNSFAGNSAFRQFIINKTFKTPIKVRCTGTTAVVGSIADNSLHVIAISDVTTNNITYKSRIRFTG